jgi:hypothetical protein
MSRPNLLRNHFIYGAIIRERERDRGFVRILIDVSPFYRSRNDLLVGPSILSASGLIFMFQYDFFYEA